MPVRPAGFRYSPSGVPVALYALSPDGARNVSYTLWSRGCLIGETDLGFPPLIDLQRSGDFHPNDDGERLMAKVACPLPAMRAYLHRDARDAAGNGFVLPEMHDSALFADLAESFQRFRTLELELRRDDGSVVPTADIGFQDTHYRTALADAERDAESARDGGASPPVRDLSESSDADRQLDRDVLHDLEALDLSLDDCVGDSADDAANDTAALWERLQLDAMRFPRYQVHVTLLDGKSIP